jgi:hypothetical protein
MAKGSLRNEKNLERKNRGTWVNVEENIDLILEVTRTHTNYTLGCLMHLPNREHFAAKFRTSRGASSNSEDQIDKQVIKQKSRSVWMTTDPQSHPATQVFPATTYDKANKNAGNNRWELI